MTSEPTWYVRTKVVDRDDSELSAVVTFGGLTSEPTEADAEKFLASTVEFFEEAMGGSGAYRTFVNYGVET